MAASAIERDRSGGRTTTCTPNDSRRLLRAIEVFEKTGQPISELQRQFDTGRPAQQCRVFVLDWPRPELHERIDRRVDEMFARGLVEEVQRLLASPHPLSRTARQAVGYFEVIDHLEGRQGLAETIDLVKTHTRQLAKRQTTWFRSLSECRFLAANRPDRSGRFCRAYRRNGASRPLRRFEKTDSGHEIRLPNHPFARKIAAPGNQESCKVGGWFIFRLKDSKLWHGRCPKTCT